MMVSSGNIILALTLSIYIIVALYSTIFAYRRLQRPGVSKNVRTLFVRKHFLYVIVFILIWTIQLSQNYYVLLNPHQNSPSRLAWHKKLGQQLGFIPMKLHEIASENRAGFLEEVISYIAGTMTFSTGIFLTGIRLYEPLFRFLALQKIYQFWGELHDPNDGDTRDDKQVSNDALSTFLSSSLNVELVFIILKSITTFAGDSSNKIKVMTMEGKPTP